MIELAFKHKCSVMKYMSMSYDGKSSYSSPVQYPCYKQEGYTKVLALNGEETTSRCVYYLKREITPDDIVDNFPVINVDIYNMLGIKYYRVYT